jgi:hypothetical protein
MPTHSATGTVPRGGLGERQMVDMRGNPADHAAVALGKKELRLGMAEPGVLAGRDEAVNLLLQRRHPIGIARVQAECDLDKGLTIRRSLDGPDGHVHVQLCVMKTPVVPAAKITHP